MARTNTPPTSLDVLILSGEHLAEGDVISRGDPYIKVVLGKLTRKTSTKKGKRADWMEFFTFPFNNERTLEFFLYDENVMVDTHLGTGDFPLDTILNTPDRSYDGLIHLWQRKERKAGELHIKLQFMPKRPALTSVPSHIHSNPHSNQFTHSPPPYADYPYTQMQSMGNPGPIGYASPPGNYGQYPGQAGSVMMPPQHGSFVVSPQNSGFPVGAMPYAPPQQIYISVQQPNQPSGAFPPQETQNQQQQPPSNVPNYIPAYMPNNYSQRPCYEPAYSMDTAGKGYAPPFYGAYPNNPPPGYNAAYTVMNPPGYPVPHQQVYGVQQPSMKRSYTQDMPED